MGVILAGGGATRFGGAPKGLQVVEGARIIDRVAAALREATDELLLVANDPGVAAWLPGVRTAADVRTGEGAAATLGKSLSLRGDAVTVFNGAAAQLGLLGGVLAHRLAFKAPQAAVEPPLRPTGSVWRSGAATFLIAMPVLIASAKGWEIFLRVCGLPTEKQDLIGMFVNAKSPWMLTIMILLAVAIAPLAEELVFRAGLFRYFRTRMPHAIALVVPAIFFACLHVNWTTLQGLSSLVPLIVLACIFSLAYERTGRIGTPIVAHALFNLNTVLLILAGVGV